MQLCVNPEQLVGVIIWFNHGMFLHYRILTDIHISGRMNNIINTDVINNGTLSQLQNSLSA